jgi:hypothetical protein
MELQTGGGVEPNREVFQGSPTVKPLLATTGTRLWSVNLKCWLRSGVRLPGLRLVVT